MSKEKKNSQSTKKSTKKKEEKIVEEKVTKTKSNTKSKDTKKEKPTKEKEVKKVIEEEIIEDNYDEDLEDAYFEEKEEKKVEIKTSKKDKKKKEISKKKEEKKEKISNENIKKIEKIAKEKNKKTKNKSSKLKNFGIFLETHRSVITSFIVGVLLTIFVVIIIWPDRIAELKDGTQPIVKVGKINYTADELYEDMKESYSVSKLLDTIDNDLLTKLYEENDEMMEEVNSNAEYYLNMYEQYYNYTEEQFLEANGFANYDAFLEYLKLDYRRNKYLDEYIEENLTDKEIEEYYNDNVYGDINCQHVLVEVSTDTEDENALSDEDAKKLAEEIIDKINDGTSWNDIKEEYKDKVTFEDLGYQTWNSDLEESFKNALKDMDDESFSEEPVKTSYGYHVIYRLDQKKTPSLKNTKDTIVENLISDKKSEDSNLLYKALINLRNENKITFSDTDMEAKYESYKKQYN